MPELHFKGKEFVYNHHLTVPYRPLIPDASKSVGSASLGDNLIIHGDNLHALKALMPRFAGKVDCIFIDPPYNTGNENWCYNDNVNSPMLKEWLSSNPVNKEDMLRHDKWLAMMYPRLKLLHEILAETGSIWITLNDIEVHRAKLILDEIFGEDNFIADIAWEKVYSSRMDATSFSEDIDHILVYQKSEEFEVEKVDFQQNEKQFKHIDEISGKPVRLRSLRKEGKNSLRTDRPNTYYPIVAPDGTPVYPIKPDGKEGTWRWEQSTLAQKLETDPNALIFVKDENSWQVYVKQFYKGLALKPPSTLFKCNEYGHTHEALEEIKKIFGESKFPTPKPVRLIKKILEIATDENSIVLDNFSGSGTTAEAVLQLNNDDDGNRKFILVECEDYADSITAERVRRVIKGYEFQGMQREELLSENITFTSLKKSDKLLHKIEGIENLEKHRFGTISKTVKDGVLKVVGEKAVKERAEGLGGSFTYSTLGEPVDIDKMLTGENLPDYESIGAWLFHTATGEAVKTSAIDKENWYLGESAGYFVWLVYKPDLDFLKSREAALTLNFAEKITGMKIGKRHLVFAPVKYVPNKTLLPMGVEYAPLPFALYRVEKG